MRPCRPSLSPEEAQVWRQQKRRGTQQAGDSEDTGRRLVTRPFFLLNNSPSEHFLTKGFWSNLPSLFPHLHKDGDGPPVRTRYPEPGGRPQALTALRWKSSGTGNTFGNFDILSNKPTTALKTDFVFFCCKIHAVSFTYWSHATFSSDIHFFGEFYTFEQNITWECYVLNKNVDLYLVFWS